MKEEADEIDSLLGDLGYNLYQKKAYKALVSANRPATVAEIAKLSHVPQPKLYEIMESLEQASLVTSTATRPKEYSLSKVTAMENDIRLRQERLQAHMGALATLSQKILTTPQEPDDIRILRGRENVLSHLANMLDNTVKDSFDTILPLSHPYPELIDPMRKAIARGVKIRIIGHIEGQLSIATNYLNMGLSVRLFRGQVIPNPIRLVVGDEDESLFIISGATKNYLTILTNSKPITQTIHTLFKSSWNSGADVGLLLREHAPSTLGHKHPYTPGQRLLLETIAQCYDTPKTISVPGLAKPFAIYPGTYNPTISNVIKLLAQGVGVLNGEAVLATGSASDYLGLLASKAGARSVTINCLGPQEAAAASRNAKANGLPDSCVHTGRGLEGLGAKRFDHIIYNPPLIDEEPASHLESTLYDKNRQQLRQFIKAAPNHLTEKGRVTLVYTDKPDRKGETGTSLLHKLCAENHLSARAQATTTKHGETYTAYSLSMNRDSDARKLKT